jgi:hypothetical protein
MDIKTELLKEHSKSQTNKIIKYVADDKLKFKELINLFFNGEFVVKQRAAWPLSYVAIEHPELIKHYFSKLTLQLSKTENHPSINRNILRIFEEMDIPEKHHGNLIDLCLKFIVDIKQPIAIRAFSITVAVNISKNYPELKRELLLILDELKKYPQQPAITVRIRDAMKKLK